MQALISASISARLSAEHDCSFAIKSPTPLFTSTPISAKTSACFVNTSSKKTETAHPNSTGSETFIIVAFKCNENNTPDLAASAICSLKNLRRAATLMNVASATSLSSSLISDFRDVTAPSLLTNSLTAVPACAALIVVDFSFEKKSSPSIDATCVSESDDQVPIECGCLRANSLTALGARRSEFPSRSNGLTALPLTRS